MKNPKIKIKTIQELQKQFQKFLKPHSKFHLVIPALKAPFINQNTVIIELGGTHLKLYHPNNKGIIQKFKQLDFYHNITYTPTLLNKQIFHHLKQFLSKKDLESLQKVFFIFAYPLEHFWRENTLDGICLKFSKSHQSKGIIKSKIGLSLEKFLQQKCNLKAEVFTFNDSLSTVFGNFNRSTDILNLGIIVGTGANCGVSYCKDHNIQFFNTEFGTYSIPFWSEIDKELIKNTGKEYQVEKMISGNWQYQLFHIAINKLVKQNQISTPKNLNQLQKWESNQLEKYFSKLKPKSEIDKTLQTLWYSITERGAVFLSLAISTLIKNFKYKKVNLTLTGAVFEHTINFEKQFLTHLKKHLPKHLIKAKFIHNTTPDAVKNLFF